MLAYFSHISILSSRCPSVMPYVFRSNLILNTMMLLLTILCYRLSEDTKMAAIQIDVPCMNVTGVTNFFGNILYLPSNGTGPFELFYGGYTYF